MFIASASNVVKFHEFPSNTLIHSYQPSSKIDGSCRSLSWCKDGSWLAVVPHSGFAEIVTIKNKCKLLHIVQDVSEPSCACFQNLTKRNLAVGTKYGQVLLYDIKARSVKARFPRTSSTITHVGFTAKDTHCFAGCANGDLLLFNNVAKNLACTLRVPKSSSLTDVKAHVQRRNYIIGGSNEGIIVVWDTNVNQIRFLNEAHKAPVTATRFSPINASLIVSAGLDRQVCVFDIENRQRITNIPVDNNILSIDFLDDSMYMIMGSQNGKLHVYDTRNLPHPVCSFDAHQSAVRHISFQGCSDENVVDSNSFSFGSEDVLKPRRSNEEVQTGKKRTSDFFGAMVQERSFATDPYDGKTAATFSSIKGEDSFIQALGLDRNNTADSIREEINSEDNVGKLYTEDKLRAISECTPTPPKIIDEKLLHDSRNAKQATSTPKVSSQNFLSPISPFVSNNVNQSRSVATVSGVSVTEIQNATKEIIQEEVRKALNELESKVSYEFMNIGCQIRRMILDLHMAILKESIKVENYCNSIMDEINSEPSSNRESYLLEENINLRKKVQELERQISSLTIRSVKEESGNE